MTDALFAAATLTAAAVTAVALVVLPGGQSGAAALPPLQPRLCHPVDSDDVREDVSHGEQESLDDEGEIQCVSDKQFRRLRVVLGLDGKMPAPA